MTDHETGDLLDTLDGDLLGDGDGRTLLDVIQQESPEWDILAVDIADRSGEEVYCLVIRRRVSEEGNMILSERYFKADLSDLSGGYLGNGIERRITGNLASALRVLYAATTDGSLDPDSPMLMDSTGEGITYHPEDLTEPIGSITEVEEEITEETDTSEQPETKEIDTEQFVDDRPAEATETEASETTEEELAKRGLVRCEKCGETVDKEEAVQFGKGDLGDFWIHDGGCPEEGEADE